MMTSKTHSTKVIARNIALIAQRRGYSCSKMSSLCKVDNGTLSRIFKRGLAPTIPVLEKIMESLHITIEELTRIDGSELY